MKLRIGGILERSTANGPGERFVVWTQGCTLACRGCFNQGFWPAQGGCEIEPRALADRVNRLKGLRGVTVSGGEPLEQAQAVCEFLAALDPSLDSVLFTGFSAEEISGEILARADLIVAGRYVRELASEANGWAGSSNKAVLALTGRVTPEEFPACRVEVQIGPSGSSVMTGFPPAGLRNLTSLM